MRLVLIGVSSQDEEGGARPFYSLAVGGCRALFSNTTQPHLTTSTIIAKRVGTRASTSSAFPTRDLDNITAIFDFSPCSRWSRRWGRRPSEIVAPSGPLAWVERGGRQVFSSPRSSLSVFPSPRVFLWTQTAHLYYFGHREEFSRRELPHTFP